MRNKLLTLAVLATLPSYQAYAAVVEAGDIFIDDFGQYNVGLSNGQTGNVTVDGGSGFAHNGAAFVGNLAGSTGIVNVLGAGSTFSTSGRLVIGNGNNFNNDPAASGALTSGSVNVLAGAGLSSSQILVGVQNGEDSGGGQQHGRADGRLVVSGAGSSITTGSMHMGGTQSRLDVTAGATFTASQVFSQNGTIDVDSGLLQSPELNIGLGGRTSTATIRQSQVLGAGQNTALRVGSDTGSGGTVVFDGSILTHDAQDEATIDVGNRGTGRLEFLNQSDVDITANALYMGIGDEPSGTGTVLIDNSDVSLTAADNFSSIGRDGGTGSLTVTNNGSLAMHGQAFADPNDGREFTGIHIGRDGGTGTLNITSGGRVTLSSDSLGGGFSIPVTAITLRLAGMSAVRVS